MADLIHLINNLPDAARYAWMDAQPLFWCVLKFVIEFASNLRLFEDGSIG